MSIYRILLLIATVLPYARSALYKVDSIWYNSTGCGSSLADQYVLSLTNSTMCATADCTNKKTTAVRTDCVDSDTILEVLRFAKDNTFLSYETTRSGVTYKTFTLANQCIPVSNTVSLYSLCADGKAKHTTCDSACTNCTAVAAAEKLSNVACIQITIDPSSILDTRNAASMIVTAGSSWTMAVVFSVFILLF
jgi:hypothetical protein